MFLLDLALGTSLLDTFFFFRLLENLESFESVAKLKQHFGCGCDHLELSVDQVPAYWGRNRLPQLPLQRAILPAESLRLLSSPSGIKCVSMSLPKLIVHKILLTRPLDSAY